MWSMRVTRLNIGFALIALLALAACSSRDEPAPAPAKPNSVPASAVWVGGVDGGVFVDIGPAAPGEYRVRVFQASGETEVDGVFVPGPATSPTAMITASSISGWDGEQLLLDDGGSLVAKSGG